MGRDREEKRERQRKDYGMNEKVNTREEDNKRQRGGMGKKTQTREGSTPDDKLERSVAPTQGEGY